MGGYLRLGIYIHLFHHSNILSTWIKAFENTGIATTAESMSENSRRADPDVGLEWNP